MIVVGTSKKNMALAANRLGEVGGGIVVYKDGEEIALVELPIAGLMSNERAEIVADKADGIVKAFRDCGCHLNNANMQLSLLGLVVIPELRISDLGIVDVTKFEIVSLFVKPGALHFGKCAAPDSYEPSATHRRRCDALFNTWELSYQPQLPND